MRRDLFSFLADTVHRDSGIVLEADKDYLVESRLRNYAADQGFDSVEGLASSMRERPNRGHIDAVVDLLTTNETSFFRDRHPYDVLRESLLPELIAAAEPQRRLRIWSMACSTGQEPYSIMMLLREHFPYVLSWDFRVLATDISTTALEQAQAGIYGRVEVSRGLPDTFRTTYMTEIDGRYRVADTLREHIEFRRANITSAVTCDGPFDLILLRNVLIYFNDETKARVFRTAHRNLKSHGRLMLGSTETVPGSVSGFRRLSLPKVSVFSQA